jgi:hypothetical protein
MPKRLSYCLLSDSQREGFASLMNSLRELEMQRDGGGNAGQRSLWGWIARLYREELCRAKAAHLGFFLDDMAKLHDCDGWDWDSLGAPQTAGPYPAPFWHILWVGHTCGGHRI